MGKEQMSVDTTKENKLCGRTNLCRKILQGGGFFFFFLTKDIWETLYWSLIFWAALTERDTFLQPN